MNWDKAKNLIILFLVVLNCGLLILLNQNTAKYIVTKEQETAIFNVMKRNNIGLYAAIPKEYTPMAQIELTPNRMNSDKLIDIFFDRDQELKRTLELDKEIMRQGEAVLTVEGSSVIFENPKGDTPIEKNRSNVKQLCDQFITANIKSLPDYMFDNMIEKPIQTENQLHGKKTSSFNVIYRQKYKDMLIYTNYIIFTVEENGIVKIEIRYNKPTGFEHEKKEILAPDEALFVFMQQVKDLYGDREVIVDRMDMVYFQEEDDEVENELEKAMPYYRFYIKGEEKPFLIQGYGYSSGVYRE